MRIRHKLLTGALLLCAGLTGPALAQEAAPPADAASAATEVPPPYDCTLTQAVLCQAGQACAPAEKLGELPLPARVLVHFEKQILAGVSADGLPHVTTITDLAQSGNVLVMLGIDGATGWVMHATTPADKVSFVAADEDTVASAFGTCKPVEAQ